MSQTQIYTILAGDSLWRISQQFGTTVDELVRLNNFSSQNVVIHPGQEILVPTNGAAFVPSYSNFSSSANVEKMIQWFKERKGKVGYSMSLRMGPSFYDCSSAVYNALIYAGFLPKGTGIGNTDSLFALENKLLIEIPFSEVRRGDIFISGYKGNSGNEYGHTGVFLDKYNIIHCTSNYNGQEGIVESPHAYGQIVGIPTYYYRLKGTNTTSISNSNPKPTVTHSPASTASNEIVEKDYAESGTFTANKNLNICNEPNEKSPTVNTLFIGESVTYDKVFVTNKYIYISYISYSGVRRYIAIRTNLNGTRGPIWGNII
ncbi:SH3 domain-containing protein [Aerococcaceae bacterium zg-ZJ1578]|uniref:peptidoglycan amidohydrolase family protein n=1 Tax=Aerococcaceae bacterium zg-252 TaxID=2796928 RepID=UPI001A1E2A8E|nr:SH3 domain-containing protein [Aerococcaceae bacterium zg-1578]